MGKYGTYGVAPTLAGTETLLLLDAGPTTTRVTVDTLLSDRGVPKTLFDAAGDILIASAADTPARLAPGTALQTLRMNAGATSPQWVSGGQQLIDSTTLAATATTITLTPIAGFSHLRIILQLRVDGASTGTEAVISAFNADTNATNYDNQQLLSIGGAATATALLATGASRRWGTVPQGGASAGAFGKMTVDIPFYADTTSWKTAIWTAAVPRSRTETHHLSGQTTWANTAAITAIVLSPATATNFAIGSKAMLYGIG